MLRERSPRLQPDSRRLEVAVAHNPNERLRHVAPGIKLSFTGDAPGPVVPQRQAISDTDRHNAGDRSDPVQHIVNKRVLLRETGDSKTWVDPQRGRPFGLKSQVYVQNAQKTPNQQPGANQQ